MNGPIYRRRQSTPFVLLPYAAGALVIAVGAVLSQPGVMAIGVVPLIVGYLFASLTVIVDREAVRWHFGFGFWRNALSLADVESVSAVRNKWWYGWGIRYTPHGWLYNIAGLDAVEIRLRSGKFIRIGTHEPQQLASAISNALPANR